MTAEIIGTSGLVILFILLILRAPLAIAMVVVGMGGVFVLSFFHAHPPFLLYLKQYKTLLWNTVSNYELSIIPLFVLMGYLSVNIGISRDLFAGVYAIAGHLRGGVAIATVGACAGFGAVCGSSLATASTMGRIALPELKRAHYHPGFAAGVLAAGGTLGILIPPSVVLVIYAIIVEASIIKIFQAAILPSILAICFFIIAICVVVHLFPTVAKKAPPLPAGEKKLAILRAIPALLIFGITIFGLSIGLFPPTPAAGVGVAAVICYGLLSKRLTMNALCTSLLDTAKTAAMIVFVLFGAEVLKGFFTRSGLATALSQWAQTADMTPITILLLVLLALIILGCFMDSFSMILVITPFFWPVLVEINGGEWISAADAAFNMDVDDLKIWFGILCLIVVELGLITPPVGLNVFVIAAMDKNIPMNDIFRGVLPFLSVEIIRIGLILLFPAIALWLPTALG